MKLRTLVLITALALFSKAVYAETLYVTDRILLGVHQDANENSMLVTTIPSGTPVTVVQRGTDFIKIQLADGKQGYVSASYLKAQKPATAELDAAYAKLKQAQATAKKLSDALDKKERESQVRQDEIANDKSTIKELKNKLKAQQTAPASDASKAADEKIKALQAQVKQLTDEKAKLVSQSKSESAVSTHDLQIENQQLQARIEAAVANLKGQQVPSAAELASIRPTFPFWYWILLVAIFIGGISAGVGWIDYHHRKRHGGFRV